MTSSSPESSSGSERPPSSDRFAAALRRLSRIRLSRVGAGLLALGILAGAFAGDVLTPAVATFTLFYVVALSVAVWYVGLPLAYAIAVLATVAHWLATAFAEPSTTLAFLTWNAAVDVVLYVVFVQLVSTIQQRLSQEASAKREALHQLRHAERLATLGRLASGIAHEIGTPLNVISGRAELVASGNLSAEAVASSARIILGQTDRVSAIIRQLLDFARRGGTRKERSDITALVHHICSLLGPLAAKAGVEIVTSAEPVQADVNPPEIQQVVTNLLTNAIYAMPHGGRVDVSVSQRLAAPPHGRSRRSQPCTVLRVQDYGVGIPEHALGRIFEPFFTTRDVGVGTGLGLSVVYGIVQDHGGWIDVASELDRGTTISVFLPTSSGQQRADSAAEAKAS